MITIKNKCMKGREKKIRKFITIDFWQNNDTKMDTKGMFSALTLLFVGAFLLFFFAQ